MSAPYNMILTVDAETRWSSKPCAWSPDEPFTLSKLTTEAYIRDKRFKAFGFCIHEYGTDKPTQWYSHDELPRIFGMYDWKKTAVVCHNSMFDVGIMSMIYGVKPCVIFDSLSMARALRGIEVGNSLAKLAAAFGLPPKGNAVHSTDGMEELTPEVEQELREYCKHDVFLCEEIFTRLLHGVWTENGVTHVGSPYPTSELRLISMTLKMFTEPELVLDVEMLEEAVVDEREKLERALQRVGLEESTLASADKFAAVLEQYGIKPPTKISKTSGQPILALAKTDALFQQLLNGDNEEVALLCEARVATKSTQARTRAQRFIDIARNGALPIPLSYYGAGTGRWSATGSVNLQNMKRGSFLRKAIMAPDGYLLCVGDLSQIEPRVLAWLAGYDEMLDVFRSGGDPYATFGASMFSLPGLTKESHPLLRQSAKSALLGAGFQLGWAAFAAQLLVGFLGAPPVLYTKAEAKQLGVTQNQVDAFMSNEDYMKRMLEIPHTCEPTQLLVHCLAAKAIIDKYRSAAAPVVAFWSLLQDLIARSLIGGEEYDHKGVLLFRKGEIVMANGMSLKYPDLRKTMELDPITGKPTGKTQYVFNNGNKVQKLYAGRICNNCIGKGTLVLTQYGWTPIEKITYLDAVHDGVEYVRHAGLVSKGVQGCVTVDGVYMTPDHEVLTNEGWKAASQGPEPFRPSLWNAGRARRGIQQKEQAWTWRGALLELPLRLRERVREVWRRRNEGYEERARAKLRVLHQEVHRNQEQQAQQIAHTFVDRMGEHASEVSQSSARRVQELRRPWYYCLSGMGCVVRSFLQRHGRHIQIGVGPGAQGQYAWVQSRELRVGDAGTEQHESEKHAAGCECSGAERTHGYRAHNSVQPNKGGVAGAPAVRSAIVYKQVYDILNCGELQRFVVKGEDGPFIVHNCTQGSARIIMSDGLLRVDKQYPAKGTVHDEGIFLIPENHETAAPKWVHAMMTQEPKWMRGIPLNADVGVGKRYGNIK